jgi:acetoin utilization deacetylase AcuC-like enzyme
VLKGEVWRLLRRARHRPATRDQPMGFCFFNNVAVGITTRSTSTGWAPLASSTSTCTTATQRGHPRLRPARAHGLHLPARPLPVLGEEPKGLNMVNVGLPAGATGEQLRAAVQEYWMPALDAFAPQLVYISAGFDAHRDDDMAGMRWVESDYAWVTRELVAVANRHCNGRVVSMLEGGYHLHALARSVAAHVRELVSA